MKISTSYPSFRMRDRTDEKREIPNGMAPKKSPQLFKKRINRSNFGVWDFYEENYDDDVQAIALRSHPSLWNMRCSLRCWKPPVCPNLDAQGRRRHPWKSAVSLDLRLEQSCDFADPRYEYLVNFRRKILLHAVLMTLPIPLEGSKVVC